MSGRESWKTWLIIIAILLVTGLVTAVWPLILASLSNVGGGAVAAPAVTFQAEAITIDIPPLPLLAEGASITLSSFVAMLLIAALVIGVVVAVGVGIAVINLLLSRWATGVESSSSFQEGQAALEKKETERLKEVRDGRAAATEQQNDYSRWSVVATSLAVLMFAAFFGFLVADTLFPTGILVRTERIVNITGIIVVAFMLIALFVVALRLNPQRLQAVEQTDSRGIPWDTIVVILTGVLVVGLGLGLVIYFNIPT